MGWQNPGIPRPEQVQLANDGGTVDGRIAWRRIAFLLERPTGIVDSRETVARVAGKYLFLINAKWQGRRFKLDFGKGFPGTKLVLHRYLVDQSTTEYPTEDDFEISLGPYETRIYHVLPISS